MCLVSIIPDDTSGSIGVNRKKLSLLINVISTATSSWKAFWSCLRTSIPPNPPPKINIRFNWIGVFPWASCICFWSRSILENEISHFAHLYLLPNRIDKDDETVPRTVPKTRWINNQPIITTVMLLEYWYCGVDVVVVNVGYCLPWDVVGTFTASIVRVISGAKINW